MKNDVQCICVPDPSVNDYDRMITAPSEPVSLLDIMLYKHWHAFFLSGRDQCICDISGSGRRAVGPSRKLNNPVITLCERSREGEKETLHGMFYGWSWRNDTLILFTIKDLESFSETDSWEISIRNSQHCCRLKWINLKEGRMTFVQLHCL